MRIVFEGSAVLDELEQEFAEQVAGAGMEFDFRDADGRARVAIMASREDHCLRDQLWRFASGELPGSVELVISNHDEQRGLVESFAVPYFFVPVESGSAGEDPELRAEELIKAHEIELIVLARYMKILSGRFLELVAIPIINIHHSFLPAFVGASAYRQAYERGVKVIGATAHYVTEDLDEGPIIAQATAAVSHRDEVSDLIRIGRDLERVVLADAVRAHLEDRVLADGDRTVVF